MNIFFIIIDYEIAIFITGVDLFFRDAFYHQFETINLTTRDPLGQFKSKF